MAAAEVNQIELGCVRGSWCGGGGVRKALVGGGPDEARSLVKGGKKGGGWQEVQVHSAQGILLLSPCKEAALQKPAGDRMAASVRSSLEVVVAVVDHCGRPREQWGRVGLWPGRSCRAAQRHALALAGRCRAPWRGA